MTCFRTFAAFLILALGRAAADEAQNRRLPQAANEAIVKTIRSAVDSTYEKLRRFHVLYTQSVQTTDPKYRFSNLTKDGVISVTAMRELRIKDEKLTYFREAVSQRGRPVPWHHFHRNPVILISKDTYTEFWPQSRMAYSSALKSRTTLGWVDPYCEAIGIWPMPTLDSLVDRDFFIDKVLHSFEESRDLGWQILSEPEIIDGERCVVVAFGGDKLWFDPKLGYMLRRRERWKQKENGRKTFTVYQLKDFHEVGSGLALPFFCNISLYDPPDNTTPTEPVLVTQLMVGYAGLEDMDNSIFEVDRRPGTIIANPDAGSITRIPGGEEILDEAIPLVRLFIQENEVAELLDKSLTSTHVIIGMAACLLIGGAATFSLTRRFRSVQRV